MKHALLATALATFGCAADPGPDAPLATIQGSLTSSRVEPLPQPEVSVVWTIGSMMSALVGAEKVAAKGTFPHFEIGIHALPPDTMLDSLDGDAFGTALVVAAPAGTDYTRRTDWRGVDFDRIVVYLPKATTAGSTLEAFLHGSATAGFHVYNVHRLSEAERQQRLDCVNGIPRTGGMLTEHEIYTQCGGAGRDELNRAAADLDTPFDLDIVEDTGIVPLINALPRW